MDAATIASTYGQFSSRGHDEDALTARHRANPEKADNLQRILRSLGLESSVYDLLIASSRKRKIIEEGTKLIVDDHRFTGHSFKYFGVSHPLRFAAIRVVTYPKYNTIMTVAFALSSGLLLFRGDPRDLFPNDDWTAGQIAALIIDRLLIVLFILDLFVSFTAHGVLKCMRQYRYLLDTVVLGAAMAQELSTDSLHAATILFAVSSLRPLRIVSRVPSMLRLVNILVACSDKLIQVAFLILGICIAFAVAAVILFCDASHTRCYDPIADSWGSSCNIASDTDPTDFLYAPCASGSYCRTNGPTMTPYASYDHIGYAMLVLIQILTLDNWADLAVDMMNSLTPAAGVFFVLSTFLLAFWATNQFTAVIFDSFSTTFVEEREVEARRQHNKDDDAADATAGARPRLTSLRGAAPQAHRAVQRMKQHIARDSIASMKSGIKSVNAHNYVKAEVLKSANDADVERRSRREKDFFLDDTSFNEMGPEVGYRYQQLEATLPEGTQKLLVEFKHRPYKSERERNTMLNQFHVMGDRMREKTLSFLHWREDVNNGGDKPSTGGVRQGGRVHWADDSGALNLEDSGRFSASLLDHDSEELMLEASHTTDAQFSSSPCRYVPPNLLALTAESGSDEEHDVSSRSSDGIAGEKRSPKSKRQRVSHRRTEMRVYLQHLKDEHKELWATVQTILPSLRATREAAKVRAQRAEEKLVSRGSVFSTSIASIKAALLSPTLAAQDSHQSSDDERDVSMTEFGSVSQPRQSENAVVDADDLRNSPPTPKRSRSSSSSSSPSSSSSSSSSSSASSTDTLDRAVAMHEKLVRRSYGGVTDQPTDIEDPSAANVGSRRGSVHVMAARAASAVRRRQQQVRDSQRWKAAQSLDEFLENGDAIAPVNGSGPLRVNGSVIDMSLDVEEYRRSNQELLELIREYNASRTLPRPQPSRWEIIKRSVESYHLRVRLYQLLRSPWYDGSVLIATLVNCILLVFVYHKVDPGYETFVDTVSCVVDVAIVFDTVSRIALTSFATYFFLARRNIFNLVEFLIMMLCIADLVVAYTGIFAFLRVFRVLRAMKFMRRFHLLRQILLLLRTSLGYLVNLLALQIIVWVMFTYCGRQLLGSSFQADEILQPCAGFTTQSSCNYNSSNCIWVNETEFQEWNMTYMRDLKNAQSHGDVLLVSRSMSHSVSLPGESNTNPFSRSLSRGQLSRSRSLSPGMSRSLSPLPTRTRASPTWVSLPMPNAGNISTPSPYSEASSSSRTCRQFQGWNALSPFDRFSFQTLTYSFVTVFDIATKDNWSTIQYHYMEAIGPYMFIFFMAVVIVCGYLILSLLVAILLVNFEQRDEVDLNDLKDDTEAFDQDVIDTQGQSNAVLERIASERLREHLMERDDQDTRRKAQVERQNAEVQRLHAEAKQKELRRQQKRDQAMLRAATKLQASTSAMMDAASQGTPKIAPAGATAPTEVSRWNRFKAAVDNLLTVSDEAKKSTLYQWLHGFGQYMANFCDALDTEIDVVEGKSLFLFRPEHPLRVFCVSLVEGQYFPLEKVIFWVTLLHCFVSPASKKFIETTALLTAFEVIDWIISVLSLFEMLCRLIAMGGFIGPHSYIRSEGLSGVGELCLVVVSFLANLIPPIIASATGGVYEGTAIGFALKAFRPFRVVSRTSSMRNVMVAIARTVPELVNILAFSAVIYIMFAVMCVEAFRGRLQRCSDGSDRSELECVGMWTAVRGIDDIEYPANASITELLVPRMWINNDEFHFDDCYNAFTTLFKVSLVSNWGAVMYAMIDAPDTAGQSPVRDKNPQNAGWLIFWVIFSNNFLINIFVGTIVDRFSKLKDQLQGNMFISAEQAEIVRIKKSLITKTAKKVLRVPPIPWGNAQLNDLCYRIVSHVIFVKAIKYILALNTIVLMAGHYQQPQWFTDLQDYGTMSFTFVFIIELALKVCVGGWDVYFSIRFHFVEMASVIQGIVEFGFVFRGAVPPDAVQLFRLIRVVRLVRDAKGLRKILHTGYKALPAMGNIGAVLIAVIFSFAMIGIALFQDVRYDLTGNWFSPMLSLRTVPKAMFTLYAVSTLDNWAQIQLIAGVSEPDCISANHDCGSPFLASLFLNIFVVIVVLIMLNLFMAVVLENFSDAVLLPQYLEERQRDVEAFRKVWSQFDNGRNVISAASMVPLLEALPGPQQRFEQLRSTRDAAGDDDSAHSLQSEEMRVYAENQTIGLGGCPQGSIIPTIRQLKLVVTMPNEEILYLDAISALGEKIYHAQLVDERIRRAHERALYDAEETQLSFSVWYATSRFQRLFKSRLKEQKQHNLVVTEEASMLAVDASLSRGFIPPRHAAGGNAMWNTVLDPILVMYVRQHFRSAWTADGGITKMRKITLTRRGAGGGGGDENDVVEDEDVRQQRQLILEEVERRQTKSLADTIKERQVEVEEAPEVVEDDSWMSVIQYEVHHGVNGSDEDLTTLPSYHSPLSSKYFPNKLSSGPNSSGGVLKPRLDIETGLLCHAPPLEALIQNRRRGLLFQLFAQSFQTKEPFDAQKVLLLSKQTAVQLRNELALQSKGDAWNLDVWGARNSRWTPQPPLPDVVRVLPSRWRLDFNLPVARRMLDVQKKRKVMMAATRDSAPLVTDWGILFRVANESVVSVVKIRQAAREALEASSSPATLAATVSSNIMDIELDASMKSEAGGRLVQAAASTRSRSGTIGGGEGGFALSTSGYELQRHPTLLERMEELGLKTTNMRLAQERRWNEDAARIASSRQQMSAIDRITASFSASEGGAPSSSMLHRTTAIAPPPSMTTNSFVHGSYRSSAPSVRLLMEEGTELSPTAKELFQLENRGVTGERLTTTNTAGSYSLPVEEDNGLPKLSFAVLTRLSMAARRFKRRKMEAETEALRRRLQRGHGAAMSSYSKISKGQETEGSGVSDPLKRAAAGVSGVASGLKKRGETALAMFRKAKKLIHEGREGGVTAMSPGSPSATAVVTIASPPREEA